MALDKDKKKRAGYKNGLHSRIEYPCEKFPFRETIFWNSGNAVAVLYASPDDLDADITRVWLIEENEFHTFEGVERGQNDYFQAYNFATRHIGFKKQDEALSKSTRKRRTYVRRDEIDFSQFDGFVPESSHDFEAVAPKQDPLNDIFDALSA